MPSPPAHAAGPGWPWPRWGCRKPKPEVPAAQLPPLQVDRAGKWLYTHADDAGRFVTVDDPQAIPAESRAVVRVTDPARAGERKDGVAVYVVDVNQLLDKGQGGRPRCSAARGSRPARWRTCPRGRRRRSRRWYPAGPRCHRRRRPRRARPRRPAPAPAPAERPGGGDPVRDLLVPGLQVRPAVPDRAEDSLRRQGHRAGRRRPRASCARRRRAWACPPIAFPSWTCAGGC